MTAKNIGDPCPKCSASLMRRRRAAQFRATDGDIAFCARCNAAWEIVGEEAPRATSWATAGAPAGAR